MLRKHLFSAWFFIVLDLFPDTFSACMRCVNFNFVYFWSYPDLFPHTEKRHLSYLSNILQKEKSAEKSALFPLLSLLPWHQYHALNVPRKPDFDVMMTTNLLKREVWEWGMDTLQLMKVKSVHSCLSKGAYFDITVVILACVKKCKILCIIETSVFPIT